MAKMKRPADVKNHTPLIGPLSKLVWYMHKAGRFYPKVDGLKLYTQFPDQNAITIEGRTYTHEELAAACMFEPLVWRAIQAEEAIRVAAAHAGYHATKNTFSKPRA